MYFFQLPLIPEILLTAFGGSFFYYWIHRGREAVIGADNVRVYMDLYRRPSIYSKILKLNVTTKSNKLSYPIEDLTGPMNYYRNMKETLLPKFLLARQTPQAEPMHIRVPTMLIWGRNDKALSASMATLSAKYIQYSLYLN